MPIEHIDIPPAQASAMKIQDTQGTAYLTFDTSNGKIVANKPVEHTDPQRDTVAAVVATGSTQGDAAAMTEAFNVVSAADATKGVKLPVAVAGVSVLVKNNENAVLKVYPASGGTINALSEDAAISMAAFTTAEFKASSATQWFTHPLLPS